MKPARLHNHLKKFIMGTRWFLAPLYVGMSASMIVFVIKFFQELYHLFKGVINYGEAEILLSVLSLIDIALIANLVVMVIISGYETFISPIHLENAEERPGWLSKLDPGTVKIKLATSIIGISLVHLLTIYMKIGNYKIDDIKWSIIMHVTFSGTAIMLALVDKLTYGKDGHEKEE